MSTKEILREVTEKLPPDATLADAIYELEFRQGVESELVRKEANPPRVKLVRRDGFTYLQSNRTITDEDVARGMEEFP